MRKIEEILQTNSERIDEKAENNDYMMVRQTVIRVNRRIDQIGNILEEKPSEG